MAESPAPTITTAEVGQAYCEHCQATTIQVKGGQGLEGPSGQLACLQCIADGGSCCSLDSLNRWKASDG